MSTAVLERGSRPCLSEVRRLRAQLAGATAELDSVRSQRDRLTALIAAYLAADHAEAQTRLWRAYATESYHAGREDQAAELAAAWPHYPPMRAPRGPELAEILALRWVLRGQPRTRETFGQPHEGDRNGSGAS